MGASCASRWCACRRRGRVRWVGMQRVGAHRGGVGAAHIVDGRRLAHNPRPTAPLVGRRLVGILLASMYLYGPSHNVLVIVGRRSRNRRPTMVDSNKLRLLLLHVATFLFRCVVPWPGFERADAARTRVGPSATASPTPCGSGMAGGALVGPQQPTRHRRDLAHASPWVFLGLTRVGSGVCLSCAVRRLTTAPSVDTERCAALAQSLGP